MFVNHNVAKVARPRNQWVEELEEQQNIYETPQADKLAMSNRQGVVASLQVRLPCWCLPHRLAP